MGTESFQSNKDNEDESLLLGGNFNLFEEDSNPRLMECLGEEDSSESDLR